MQKVINVLAITSFAVSAAIVGAGTFVYLNKDNIIDGIKEKAMEAAMGAVTDSLPGMVDGAIPELPSVTGGAMPELPATTGGAIPAVGGVAVPF